MDNLFVIVPVKSYSKRYFKACEPEKAEFTWRKWHFEGKRDTENTLLCGFIFY